jgi:serine O-acetyltransferase
MKINELKENIYSDFFRIHGDFNKKEFIKTLLFRPATKYLFWLRVCQYLQNNNKFLFKISKQIFRRYKIKYGIDMSYDTNIGKGIYVGHFGGIVVHEETVIGDNLNISQGVTIGQTNRGKYMGTPIIGNNVYIAPGAKIIGGIKIGNNVAIGANAVVTKNVPDNAVVVGIPAEIISYQGSDEYIQNNYLKRFIKKAGDFGVSPPLR